MALVKIPTPLRRLTNEKDEVSTSSTLKYFSTPIPFENNSKNSLSTIAATPLPLS